MKDLNSYEMQKLNLKKMIGGNNGLGCYSLTILRKICLFKNGTDVIIKWKELAKKIDVFEEKLLIFFFLNRLFQQYFN